MPSLLLGHHSAAHAKPLSAGLMNMACAAASGYTTLATTAHAACGSALLTEGVVNAGARVFWADASSRRLSILYFAPAEHL